MTRDIAIRKAKLWMKEQGLILTMVYDGDHIPAISWETAEKYLGWMYAIGYDARVKDYNQSQEKAVIQENSDHKVIERFDSISDARKAVGLSKNGMIRSLRTGAMTRKGHYFKYDKPNELPEDILRGHDRSR